MRFKHILITGKCFGLTQYFISFSFWLVKTYHHQVKINSKLVHYGYFMRQSANDL